MQRKCLSKFFCAATQHTHCERSIGLTSCNGDVDITVHRWFGAKEISYNNFLMVKKKHIHEQANLGNSVSTVLLEDKSAIPVSNRPRL